MNPGKLRHRITIEQKSGTTKDAEGIAKPTWIPFATVSAAIIPLNGRERTQAAAISAEASIRVEIRYKKGVTADMRVNYGGRILEIVAPPQDLEEKHIEMHLLCKEVGLNG